MNSVQPRACGERRITDQVLTPRLPVQPRACGERRMRPSTLPSVVVGSAPRVRGTRIARAAVPSVTTGSAPRVRGTPLRAALSRCRGRFSPARAGNAKPPVAVNRRRFAVQPRACGERACSPTARAAAPVQPRACGERDLVACDWSAAVQPRACGERDLSRDAGTCREPVQPRACGERSSPTLRDAQAERFSPARAGNAAPGTRCDRVSAGSAPRVRGTRRCAGRIARSCGSAPRVRGTLSIGDARDG